MKSNKKLGNDFEQEVCAQLAKQGFWVHNFANRTNGQPADIIAAKADCIYLIDAKVCSNGSFQTSRIEENQVIAMKRWFQTGNKAVIFYFKLSNGEAVPLILENEEQLDALLQKKVLREEQLRKLGGRVE